MTMLRFLKQIVGCRHAILASCERHHYPLTYAFLCRCYPAIQQQNRELSSLYINERTGKLASHFQTDIDISEKLQDVDGLKKNLKLRSIDLDVDKLVEDHRRMSDLEKERIHLETERKRIATLIASLLKIKNEQLVSKEIEAQIAETKEEGKKVKEALKKLMPEWWDLKESLQLSLLSIPNYLLFSVPEEDPSLIQEFFPEKKIASKHSHVDLVNKTGLVKFSNIGPRTCFLQGKLAELEQSLIQQVSSQLCKSGYVQMVGPDFFKTTVVESAGVSYQEPPEVYRLAEKAADKDVHIQDQMWLRGSSYMTFLAYLARNVLLENQLPMKLFTVGREYTPETAAGSQLPGLFGVLQSVKLNGCCISRSVKDNMKQLQECQAMVSDMYRQFKLPYRLVNMPVTSLSSAEQNRVELQFWIPSLQQYMKMASVSSMGDHASRRLMIRCSSRRHSSDTQPVYMTAVEVCDVTRMIAVLIEYEMWDQETV